LLILYWYWSEDMSGFDNIAAYYEALSDSEARAERERPFLEEWLRRAPGNRVLDMACGTGFHAVMLANLGARVVATDISPRMIGTAEREHGHPSIAYVVNDMRWPINGPYDLSLCLGNSISLLETRGDLPMMLKNLSEALAAGGYFIVHLLNYALPTAGEPRHRIERRIVDDTEVVAIKSLVPHKDRTLLSLAFFSEAEGQYQSIADTGVLLHISLEDLSSAAETAGLKIVATHGAYDKSPFRPEFSADLIVVMQK
jgi:SAM-dependent methyltransferase